MFLKSHWEVPNVATSLFVDGVNGLLLVTISSFLSALLKGCVCWLL